jgi:hypothetical protein
VSDELTAELRELAEAGVTPPPVSGAEIRRLAVRRRRRRRTTAAVAGASAAAALALGLTLTLTLDDRAEERPSPAASPTGTPSALPVRAEATIDLRRLVLTIDGRTLPISAGTVKTPTPTGRMTVTAKQEAKTVASDGIGFPSGYDLKALWVLELRAADGRTTYLAALTYDDKAPGNYDSTGGWIGLRTADAKWLYSQLRQGSVVDVESSLPAATVRPPAATSPSATSPPAPRTGAPEAASVG